MSAKLASHWHTLALCLAVTACKEARKLDVAASTAATVEVQHPGVRVGGVEIVRRVRVAVDGALETAADGRALVRTDNGLELRVAGDARIVWVDGVPRVERGRVFVTGYGDDERAVEVGADARVAVGDAALEIERAPGAPTRVIAVRGEVSYRQGARQGQLAQGEALEGAGALAVNPAGVWDDWTGGAASPQGLVHRSPEGAGRMFAHPVAGEGPTALAINEQRVRVVVHGDLAITTIDQRFFNGSEQVAPVEYRMRLPEGAMTLGFEVERGGRASVARPAIVGARNAQGGATSALLGTTTRDVVAGLGYLAPGENVRAQLTYAEWLTHDGAQRAYVLAQGDAVTPQIVGEFAFDLDLSRSQAARVRVPEGAQLQNGHVVMRRSDWRPRGDLVVELVDPAAPATPSARLWQSARRGPDGADHVMVDVTLPADASAPSDLAIVIDASAATAPGALEIARASVDALLHQVGAADRVALFLGDLGARPAPGAAGQMEVVTPARREAILDAIAHLRPGGASDLGRMLTGAAAALDPRRNGAVFYLGDATPTLGTLDPGRLVDEVSRAVPDLRLYALALGHDSHPEIVAPLAAMGGRVGRVEDTAEAVSAATEMLAHALRPCLRDVRVSLGDHVVHPLPDRVGAWVAGDPLQVVGELSGEAPRTIRVTARRGTEAQQWSLPVRVTRIDDRGDLGRRWAAARIEALLRHGTGRSSLAELGARYQLVTPMSGLVLDAEGQTPTGAYTVNAPVFNLDDEGARLPVLGVTDALRPRGVEGVGASREVAIARDDGDGWRPHAANEGQGLDPNGTLVAALASAEPAARACVERKRALRPGLAGTITVSATVDATGRVTSANVAQSTLRDAEVEGCVRRAVLGVTLPAPELLGAAPGTVTRGFEFGLPPGEGRGPGARVCAPTATLPRGLRRVLWLERLSAQGLHHQGALAVWNAASQRCELRWWEDRVALLELIVERVTDPAELVSFRNVVNDPSAIEWLDAAIARRYGPSEAWRAYLRLPLYVDWSRLLTRLSAPGTTAAQKVTLLRAWLVVAPRDIDLRLRLMTALEEADRMREARTLGERLRRDPLADARVRSLVGELMLRAGDRDEALRAFTEIAEFAPYDPYARARLGDLLLTYGWPAEAYHQYQTLAALRPGETEPLVRVALAALASGREDEGLRTLRRAAEAGTGDAAGRVLQTLLDGEVARVAAGRPDDPAVRAWVRVARQLRAGREAQVVVRWTHPDLGVELLAQSPSETSFASVGESPLPLGVRVFEPGTALEGNRFIVRAPVGITGQRLASAVLQLLSERDGRTVRLEQTVQFDRAHRAYGFRLQDGRLVAEPVAPSEEPPAAEVLY